jgi:hypothetical protein
VWMRVAGCWRGGWPCVDQCMGYGVLEVNLVARIDSEGITVGSGEWGVGSADRDVHFTANQELGRALTRHPQRLDTRYQPSATSSMQHDIQLQTVDTNRCDSG